MIFDSDVLIWSLRGNEKAADAIERTDNPAISVVSSMELFHGARDKGEMRIIGRLLQDFRVLPLSADIGYRANEYMEQYALRVPLDPADALIAATAVEHRQPLCTGNSKHYRLIPELELRGFRL